MRSCNSDEGIRVNARLIGEFKEYWEYLLAMKGEEPVPTEIIKEAIKLRWFYEVEKREGRDLFYLDDDGKKTQPLSELLTY